MKFLDSKITNGIVLRMRPLLLYFLCLPLAITHTLSANENRGQANIADEMEAYRAIQNRPVTTVQDLADLLLMYRGEYAKFTSQEKRLERVRELGLLKKDHEGHEELDRGTLAYALMKVYEPEKGWLYWLTGWERYALRDVQEAGIMPNKSTPEQKMSGDQLLAIMTDAEEFVTRRNEWQKEEK
ncbi:MAG: hypothetical protein OHK0011_10290 [Turneriella sp.]